ncbi:CHASE2 domain-containing protein [Legionella sp. MW5194]|uniref:CHASE2 domain-containing protein n=1 Tax=Legionella sp. MW5194 TaxID=2662448 RepID=UPI00193D32F5|nr:adenylate/guanylate cyclase domain-containing protein [Legionella sp. MW5194]QRN04924.1 CHASE2 domain-containing protein [Legionella sp. MW5194]
MDVKASFKAKRLQILAGFVVVIASLGLEQFRVVESSHFLHRLDNYFYDILVRNSPRPLPSFPRVVIADIDDYSVAKKGRWPWPRAIFAQLIERLKEYGVILVAFDVVFSEPEINYALGLKDKIIHLPSANSWQPLMDTLDKLAPAVDNDLLFARAMQTHETVLGYLFYQAKLNKGALPAALLNEKEEAIQSNGLSVIQFQGYQSSLKSFIEAARFGGFVSNFPDADGLVRHGLLVAGFENKLYPSLSLAVVMRYLLVDHVSLITRPNGEGKAILTGLNVGGTVIPLNPSGQILIPFFGEAGTLPYYSIADLLDKKVPAEELAGAIVIVGSSTILLSDRHPTPVSETFPGVEINANVIAAILNQQIPTIHHSHHTKKLVEMSLLGAPLILIMPFLGPVWLIGLYLLLTAALLLGSFLLFTYKNTYFSVASFCLLLLLLALVNFLYEFVYERRQKNKIKRLFGQYVPPSHIEEMTNAAEHFSMEGETREMSVLFSDVRDFTAISESLDASTVKWLLNALFTPMTRIIFEHQGTIDKYVGDMVMAFWGAPLHDEQHAFHAVAAALAIKTALPTSIHHGQVAFPEIKLGIGISTGKMDVGDMGSEFRRAYTVIGDTVNLASRLEQLTKFYHVDILVSEATRASQDAFVWQLIDKVTVKGRQQPLAIYEPLGYQQEADAALLTQLQDYEAALAHFYQQRWSQALTAFQELQKCYPDRYLYELYIQRIMHLRTQDLPPDWNGVFVHTHK